MGSSEHEVPPCHGSVSAPKVGQTSVGVGVLRLLFWKGEDTMSVALLVASVSEASATEGIVVASIVVPLLILAVVSWFFWRASNRNRRENP